MDKMRGHKNARQCLLNCYIYFCATFVYNSSTKGSDDVTKSERFEQLDRLLTEHDGMLQTAQVIASGIVKPIFYEYVKEKNLQQVAHGIYVSEDTWIDAMFLLHLRCGQAVFSHESALFFHD